MLVIKIMYSGRERVGEGGRGREGEGARGREGEDIYPAVKIIFILTVTQGCAMRLQ